MIRNLLRVLTGKPREELIADTTEQGSTWDPNKSWFTSEQEELEERLQEQVWETLALVKFSIEKRRVLFPGGHRLTLPQALGHLQKLHKDIPVDTVESALLEWLEMNTAPENVTQKQMDKHDEAIESWLAEYWKYQENLLENS